MIHLAQDMDRWRALVNALMNLQVTSNAGNFLNRSETTKFSRTTSLHGVSQEHDYIHSCGRYLESIGYLAQPFVIIIIICNTIIITVTLICSP